MGSPREGSNTDVLTDAAAAAAEEVGAEVDKFAAADLDIEPCRGCLKCNVLAGCANSKDGWQDFAYKWRKADGVIIASPVYFHNVTGQLKIVLDRFRSFIHVTMGEEKLEYAPSPSRINSAPGEAHNSFNQPEGRVGAGPKKSIIILVQGEPSGEDYKPALETLEFFLEKMCAAPPIGHLVGTSLAMHAQINMTRDELAALGEKTGWSKEHPDRLLALYGTLKTAARDLGRKLAEACRGQ